MLDIIERFGVNVVPLEMRGPLYNGWQHNAMLLGRTIGVSWCTG